MSLVLRLFETCREQPQKSAVVEPSGSMNYQELMERIQRMAALIGAAVADSHVGIVLPTAGGFPVAFFGCLAAGKVPVPLNFLLAPTELEAVIRDAGLRSVVTCQAFEPLLRPLVPNAIVLEALSPPAGPLPGLTLPEAGDAVAVILYTSGTSGQPKGVELTHANLRHCAQASVAHARLKRDHVFLGLLPLFHAFGLTATMILPLVLGATVVYLPRFSGPAALEAIGRHRVSVIIAVASMYGALARAKAQSDVDTSSLQLCVSGGEPLPRSVADAFRAAFGLDLLEGYGLTETSPIVSINVPGQHRPGSVGRPIPGVRFTIVDDQGRSVAAGQHGEVLIEGPVVMRGYFGRPSETAAAVDAAGRLHTGDLGYLDADGYLWITGRKKDLIISGGANIYPREVEEVLLAHPDVAEAAVIGIPDPLRGEAVKAFVVLRPGAAVGEADLRQWCRSRLARYKVPRAIVVRDELPRAPTGKVLKSRLKQGEPPPESGRGGRR